jgi:hypothetical protein
MAIDRPQLIGDIEHLLEYLEDMGASANNMGHLTYREAASFHAITRQLRGLVKRLNRTREVQSPDNQIGE